jgi:hypothetical protein
VANKPTKDWLATANAVDRTEAAIATTTISFTVVITYAELIS